MKRICLFAGFNINGIIEDYVLYYLQELSKISDIYYLADNKIMPKEFEKITPYVKGAYGYKHGKYDFGSWQELINKISWEKIAEYDELILTNDSVFGPIRFTTCPPPYPLFYNYFVFLLLLWNKPVYKIICNAGFCRLHILKPLIKSNTAVWKI